MHEYHIANFCGVSKPYFATTGMRHPACKKRKLGIGGVGAAAAGGRGPLTGIRHLKSRCGI
jgi:hypothetical protein